MRRVRAVARPQRPRLARLVLVRAGAVALFAFGVLLGVGVGLGITGGLRPEYPAGRPSAEPPRHVVAAKFPEFDEEIPW
jgi:hypothetical protein